MAEERRISPDELLARVQSEEKQAKRGRLKIFLGYAPGVGKTFAMLTEAHQQKKTGVDVVVGYVDTHGRPETGALLEGLETVPPRETMYRSVRLKEMDIDAVLARKPALALVDELAHTNVPDSRHPKRYQDVEELLAAGINVYTTLNIQHLESQRDVVAQITGVWIRETVPDHIVDQSTEIKLIDLPTEELLDRLRQGKVYVPDQIRQAIDNFFRKGNLTALRDLTMRTAAAHVEEQLHDYMQTHGIGGPWPSGERLLVCVSPGPLSKRVVRSGRRLARELNAEWVAVYVETPNQVALPEQKKAELFETLRMAGQLGAEVVRLQGDSVAVAVLEYARTHNITEIVVGKSSSPFWRLIPGNSIAERLIRRSGNIDVRVVSSRPEVVTPAPHREPVRREFNWRGYLLGFGLLVASTLLGLAVRPVFAPTNIITVYLLSVVVTALYGGFGPSMFVAVLGVLCFDFFFVPPFLTLAVADIEYVVTFVALLLVGFTVSYLTSRLEGQVVTARKRENETATLYALSRDMAITLGLENIANAVIRDLARVFGNEVVILLPDEQQGGGLSPYPPVKRSPLEVNEAAVADWAFKNGQAAGRNTDTLPSARGLYLPLRTTRGVVGVMGVLYKEGAGAMYAEQTRLLEALTDLAALAIERAQLAEIARNMRVREGVEKLQNALLNSISHELRTPLVSIVGTLDSLQETDVHLNEGATKELLNTARQEADRLNRIVSNLLDVSRIEAGAIRLSQQPADLLDVVREAIDETVHRYGATHPVSINIPPDFPLLALDFGLMLQVFNNLLDNAVKYSPAGSPIEINAWLAEGGVLTEVADRGAGIPPQELERVFDKFYRVHRPEMVSGTGLGLTICRGIIEAHGGSIVAENREGGGTVIRISLPRSLRVSGRTVEGKKA